MCATMIDLYRVSDKERKSAHGNPDAGAPAVHTDPGRCRQHRLLPLRFPSETQDPIGTARVVRIPAELSIADLHPPTSLFESRVISTGNIWKESIRTISCSVLFRRHPSRLTESITCDFRVLWIQLVEIESLRRSR
jgi:hypothetical protein